MRDIFTRPMQLITGFIGALYLTVNANATDLMDVYEAAKTSDAVLGAARASYSATQQTIPQARSALLPSLGASASTSWTERSFPGSRIMDPTSPLFGTELADQEFNDHSYNAQLNQPLLDMNAWFSLGSAKASVTAAEYDLGNTEQELIVRVVQAYLNVLRAQDLLDTTTA